MIRRHKCKTPLDPNYEEILFETSLTEDNVEAIHPDTYFKTVAWLLLAVGLGSLISFYIEAFFRSRGSNQTFPINLGGVIAAMLIRNIGDGTGKWKIDTKANDNISDICLAFFISMAIVSMKLAELIDLACCSLN
jgi:ESS family glutamate:Na+ symporter